jgi:hypothetical protein
VRTETGQRAGGMGLLEYGKMKRGGGNVHIFLWTRIEKMTDALSTRTSICEKEVSTGKEQSKEMVSLQEK